ncbi:hypothetical protein R1flu_001796 [Riccia fluitans]|uniref:Regulatory protein RecX n=1 Tax=Riccia fluitans TaxID=41844 RepID=A0ABD1Y4B1_9MARC
MDGIKSSSQAQMASWKGFVRLQVKRCTLAHSHCRVPSGSSLALSRQMSSSSLPERYIPKKSARENTLGAEVGGNSQETRKAESYDPESGRSRARRILQDNRESSVDNSADIRSLRSENLRERHARNFQGVEPRMLKKLQLPDGEKAPFGSDISNFVRNGNIRKRLMQHKDAEQAAKDYCISLLALAPQPEAKLRAKMTKKNFPSDIVDAVMADLQNCGLQSDQEYAEIFARSRWNGNAWGPSRIKFELLRRGVSKENVEAGLIHVFSQSEGADEVGQDEDERGRWGMSQKVVEQLISQARQRWSQGSRFLAHQGI